MPKVCRIGDIGKGICYLHEHPTPFTTTFDSGDELVLTNGIPTVRIGDTGTTTCGHKTIATTGSSTVSGSNAQKVHRIGDQGIIIGGGGTYTAVSGSPDTYAGD